ncbi:MAG: hypothetical protein SCARUB_04631 [Candidatus Scalindua rubra]|uniref:Uncharacterized protein n=1 Tax=Candidatus Scalindua rubra TaxID=1872076 RepID=A0A1E3X3N1_9BACT|nr:MAG: hypothetical protein SCARUB_04631 [Candidatus Scalindua rubra]
MSDVRDYDLRILDNYLQSTNVYWSALLTINGIILTFFSIDAISKPNSPSCQIYALIILCIISIWLIIINFRVVKSVYFDLDKQTIDDMPDIPEEERMNIKSEEEAGELIDKHTADWRKTQIEDAREKHKYLQIRERFFEVLMFVETLIVLWILLIS